MDSAPPCRKLGPDLQGEVMSERPYVIDQMISAKSIAARIEELSHEKSVNKNATAADIIELEEAL